MIDKQKPIGKGVTLHRWFWIVGLVGILVACGGEDETPKVADNLRPSDQDRIATATVSSATQTVRELFPSVTPSPTPLPYDPGPYFTPNRPSPEVEPAEFLPEAQVGDFNRYQTQGTCLTTSGQVSYYRSEDLGTVQLNCRYVGSVGQARNALEEVRYSALVTDEPLFFQLQGEASFLLAPSGEGLVYAWTHGRWLFTARSPAGRAALDAFMQAFPH